MGLLNIIRRITLREKVPTREIARRTGLSRNTIKKYLNADTIDPCRQVDFSDGRLKSPMPQPAATCPTFMHQRHAVVLKSGAALLRQQNAGIACPLQHIQRYVLSMPMQSQIKR
jgi:hypothetical protein